MPAFTDPELKQIQGFGVAGFNKDHQETVAIKINSPAGGKQLLAWLATQVADAFAVDHFNIAFSEIRARTNGLEPLKATWTAVMISAAGYEALGASMADLPPGESATAFQAGMAARSANIGDIQPTDVPAQWLAPFRPGAADVHLIVAVASDDECDLDGQLLAVYEQVQAAGCAVVFHERGATLPQPLTGHEHFGFKDGISQPALAGDTPPAPGEPPAVPPGDFVLGYTDSTGATPGAGTQWANGSYVVFRRLKQDVAHFRALTAAGVTGSNPALAGDALGAKMLGRWKSGAPVELYPNGDPGPGHKENAFAYQAGDPAGQVCPVWAHIRKANPRDENAPGGQPAGSGEHRMIRRGIPFGPPLAEFATADDGVDRGLHFFCVVSDIVRQFEFVQSNWMNEPNFPIGSEPATPSGPYAPPVQGTPGGPDPIVGEHDPTAAVSVVQTPNPEVQFSLGPELVTVTGGEYFFLPSIATLTALGAAA